MTYTNYKNGERFLKCCFLVAYLYIVFKKLTMRNMEYGRQ